jgi:hypothetical protein
LSCSLEFLTPTNSVSRSFDTVRSQPVPPNLAAAFYFRLGRELSDSSFFNAQTDEIFDHYVNVISPSLCRDRKPSIWPIWRVSIPQLALEHPFLLSGIIAISALHLGTLLPQRKHELQNLAIEQESAALPLFRASIKSPNTQTLDATFTFAGTLVYYVMALPEGLRTEDRCRIPSREDKYPHWFQTIRGLMALCKSHYHQLSKGLFAPLLANDVVRSLDPDSENPHDKQLAQLDDMLSSPPAILLPHSTNPSSVCSLPISHLLSHDTQNVETCKEALAHLRSIMMLVHSANPKLQGDVSLRVWPGSISQEFMEMIYERDPKALIILAHYCILLKQNDHIWYVKGLGAGLLANIWLALPEEWQPWIKWPMEQPIC